MKTESKTIEDYRNQIRRYAQSLAVGRTDVVAPHLPPVGETNVDQAKLVGVYVEGNLDKRVWKLGSQFEFLKDEFDELDEWIAEYIRTVPLSAYDTGSTDSSLFLDWVEQMTTLTPEQLDLFTCHRSRVEVEEVARVNRIGHVRFQEILSASEGLVEELESNENVWIHLNPARAWAKFETNVLLDEDEDLPATVVFYPVGSDIRTGVLEPIGQMVVDAMESQSSCRLADLLAAFAYDQREEITELVRDLADMGLIAFG